MSAIYWPSKDADEKLDYTLDWSARLGSDAISTSTWEIEGPDSLLVESTPSPANTLTETTIWLMGGTDKATYTLTNTVTTTGGRTMQQSTLLGILTK
jgi:hypothetical protein